MISPSAAGLLDPLGLSGEIALGHDDHASCGPATGASRFLIDLSVAGTHRVWSPPR
jgi:hypothetical protein